MLPAWEIKMLEAELEKRKQEREVKDNEAITRLAEYEGSGLSPEEVQELAKAKAEGRLVVLPCKVGDMVWDRFGRPWIITQIELHMYGQIWFRCGHKGTDDYTAFSSEDIGEDFFLTEQEGVDAAKRCNAEIDKSKACVREAAEKALGEVNEDAR